MKDGTLMFTCNTLVITRWVPYLERSIIHFNDGYEDATCEITQWGSVTDTMIVVKCVCIQINDQLLFEERCEHQLPFSPG